MIGPEVVLRVSEITIYPVKSLGGISCQSVEITENGLAGDRQFALADNAKQDKDSVSGRLTRRECPVLARVGAALVAGNVQLTAPGVEPLLIGSNEPQGQPLRVKAWGGPIDGFDVGEESAHWLETVIHNEIGRLEAEQPGQDAGLRSRMAQIRPRILPVSPTSRREIAEKERRPGAAVLTGPATDGYPVHAASDASLRHFNKARAAAGLCEVSRSWFRANVWFDGSVEPFSEDGWESLATSNAGYELVTIGATARCATIEASPETGVRDGQMLATLRTLGSQRAESKALVFGSWMAPSEGSIGQTIRVGDALIAEGS